MTRTMKPCRQPQPASAGKTVIRHPLARGLTLILAWVTAAAPLAAQERTMGPVIRHQPVTAAVRGQPLGVSALVQAQGAPVERVTLYYTRSRDASPSKVSMVNTGGGTFLGTLPSYHLARGDVMWYYIEAIDGNDEWSETSWQRITLVDSDQAAQAAATTRAPAPVQVEPQPSRSGPSTRAVIIGGAVVAGAAIAVAAAASSGGGGGGGGGGSSSDACSIDNVIGTWTGTNPSAAPGFVLNRNFTAVFFDAAGAAPDTGAWGLTDCVLTLSPSSPSNDVYRGSGNLASDSRSVTINGNTYTR